MRGDLFRESGRRVVIEVTANRVRALAEDGMREAPAADVLIAVSAPDDDLTIVHGRIVPARALWAALLESLITDENVPVQVDSVVLVHPTAWSPGRLALLSNAARMIAATLTMRSRAEVLAERAMRSDVSGRAFVVIEASPDDVAIVLVTQGSDGEPVATVHYIEARSWETRNVLEVARAVAAAVEELIAVARPGIGAVLVDSDDVALRDEIVDAVDRTGITPPMSLAGDDSVFRAVSQIPRIPAVTDQSAVDDAPNWTVRQSVSSRTRSTRRVSVAAGAVVVLGAAGIVIAALHTDHRNQLPTPSTEDMPTSLLVEGRVQLMVPARWAVRRIPAGGVGSARVEVVSPEDPETVVHVTQSNVPQDETLQSTADTLRAAMDKEPPGVFIDFKAADRRMDRPAVTYTEVRDTHDIAWTVLLDDRLRIGVGCQFAKDRYQSVKVACDLAVQTAKVVRSVS